MCSSAEAIGTPILFRTPAPVAAQPAPRSYTNVHTGYTRPAHRL